jgi:hypothetical protein
MLIQSRIRFILILLCISSCILFISAQNNPSPIQIEFVDSSSQEGWSCDDFPCEDDIDGFLERIQVADGFTLSHIGQFPGQPMQITYGTDGRLFGTVLEKGTRRGAVYALNDDGTSERISPRFWSPNGIAFDDKGQLYVSSRVNPDSVGAIWRVVSDLSAFMIVDDLPCCYSIDNQPNGMVFGDDGLLYVGVGSTSDRGEPKDPTREQYATPLSFEASILKIDVRKGTIASVAEGIRNPYDLSFTSDGQMYATDNGLLTGQGDRILRVNDGDFYGFPYWRSRGCPECPPREGKDAQDDWLLLDDYTLPRGLVVYDGVQFPANMQDTLFVAFWNGGDHAQRIVWIDPNDAQLAGDDYVPQPFATGLIRPVDVTVAPDGSLVIADFVYGHIWRVSYLDGIESTSSSGLPSIITTITANTTPTAEDLPPVIATVVSNSENNIQPVPASPTANSMGFVFSTATPSN